MTSAACFSTSAPRWAVVLPPEPKESGWPSALRCFASAINSFIVPTLSAAGTSTALDAALMRLIGAKRRVIAQVAVETDIDGMRALGAGDQRVAVRLRAGYSDPTVPPAPTRFSTMADWRAVPSWPAPRGTPRHRPACPA